MRLGLCLAAMAVILCSGAAQAGTATVTGTASPDKTLVTNINGPANAQQTSFTGYNGGGPYHYQLHPFTVDQSGIYTATSTTSNVINTTWILNGVFAPDPVAPATPLNAYIVAVLAPGSPSNTGVFTGFNLTAGTQYTALVAYNTGATPGVSTNSFTISGPGCIQIGAQTCAPAAPIPTLSEWAMILLGVALAGAATLTINRRRTA